jgi:hypothetical protein
MRPDHFQIINSYDHFYKYRKLKRTDLSKISSFYFWIYFVNTVDNLKIIAITKMFPVVDFLMTV